MTDKLIITKQTVTDQIVEHFRERIESGAWKPGDAFPSERQLEKELGVSRKTVNKAISVLAGQGYLFKEQGRATFVADYRAKPDLVVATRNIGFLFPSAADVFHPASAPVFRALCERFTPLGFGLKLLFGDKHCLDGPELSVRAVVAFAAMPELPETFHPPLTLVDDFDVPPRVSRVYPDVQDALTRAVDRLADLGHRRIGFLYGRPEWSTDRRRRVTFRQAMLRRGGDWMPEDEQASEYDRARTLEGLEKLLARKPTAIVGADDMVARWVIDALAERGIRTPEDMSVVGFNDMEMYSMRTPPLTTFRKDSDAMAELVVEDLLRRMARPDAPGVDRAVPYQFCERATLAPAPR